ncbi:MAG: hypothetical protein KME29_12720 [Calothrix sp. FI2-JRJ7]|nr:hypothetical protein [Calothrix sp. FI2-JRJ7]
MLDKFNSDNFNDNDVLSVKDKTFKISKVKKTIKNTFDYLASKLHENLHQQDVKIEPITSQALLKCLLLKNPDVSKH